MSAKWRRNRKRSKWVEIFRTVSRIKEKSTRQTSRTKIPQVRMKPHPYLYRISKTRKERKWKEPKPLIDVLEENDEIIIVAELAGFKKENLKIDVQNQKLVLTAETSERKYYKSLNLPKRVIPDNINTKYKNGVLEIRLKKSVEKAIDKLAG